MATCYSYYGATTTDTWIDASNDGWWVERAVDYNGWDAPTN